MDIYLAGSESYVPGYRTDYGITKFLISYAFISTRTPLEKWCKYAKFKVGEKSKTKKLFLDSGAFSVYNKKHETAFYGYIDFVQRYHKMFDVIAAYDVIRDPEATMRNYKDMLRLNLNVIPTYHYPEPIEWLHKYCKMNDYVAIGGVAHLMMADRSLGYSFLQKVIETKPKDVKYHLFGIGSNDIIKRFGHNIESVDTTRWLINAHNNVLMNRQAKSLQTRDYDTKQHRTPVPNIQRAVEYNIRRYQELENDVNESKSKVKVKPRVS